MPNENYIFFIVLKKIWKNIKIKKEEFELLMPCKLFLLRSLILRKFQIDINIMD